MEKKRLRELAGLTEALSKNPMDARFDIVGRLEKISEEMGEVFLGPALDTREKDHDKAGVRKVMGLMKKIDKDLDKVEKNIKTLGDLGL